MQLSKNLAKNINKHFSRTSKSFNLTKDNIINFLLLCWGYVGSFFCGKRKELVEQRNLKISSDQDIVINFLGCIDLRSDLSLFGEDLRALKKIFRDADISFAVSRFGKHRTKDYSTLRKQLKSNHICDVAYGNKFIKSTIYHTQAGKVAVCACMMSFDSASKHRVRVELVQEYHMLKRMGADYVVVYLDSKLQSVTTEKNKKLCELLLKAGVDYIVNVKPGILDSGVTFRQKNGSVSRALYSAGTFLSNRGTFPEGRAAIRVKLRNVNGKLQAYEEAYYPLRQFKNKGLKNLIATDAMLGKKSISVLAQVEKSMPRIRRVDRILTIGKIMEVIGAELPEQYSYLQDFSAGIISAKAIGRMPGDVYFCWQAYTDPNDKDTYRERRKSTVDVARRLRKTVMFIVTYTDLKVKTPSVVVPDTLEAHISLCKYLRSQLDVKVIAITGSIGKTSTKDMISEVMKLHYKTTESQKNENTHTRISLNVQKITSEHEVYIQEMGGGRPGGASRHSRMISPIATVVTNIGDAHLGNFYGDKTALMRNKLEITHGMPEEGIIYLNGDDPLLKDADPGCKKVLYAVHNKDADYYAENIIVSGNNTYFNIVHEGHSVAACVKVPGEHNVLNAICAYAMGKQFGIPDKTIVKGIANFTTQGIRQNIVQACGMTMFLDCYNASSGSVESSIKALAQIQIPDGAKRVAVIGDITGLGDLAEATHKEIAVPLIENPADVFIFYGNNIRYTYEAVKAQGLNAHYVNTHEAICALLPQIAKPGDVIMVKGSSKMKLEYVLDCVYGTRFFDGVLIDDNGYYRATIGNVTYNLFNTHATAIRPAQGETHVQVKSKVGASTVYSIASTFSSPTLESVTLPSTIRHIGVRAFRNSKNLKHVEGATKLKYIGMAAFKNCSSLEHFVLPETMLHIGNDAFMGCTSLKELYVPESVAQIGPNAFSNCPNLKITCKAGSYAEDYLQKNNIAYQCV